MQDVYACLFRKMLIIKFNVMITDKVFNFINKIECAWVILNKSSVIDGLNGMEDC